MKRLLGAGALLAAALTLQMPAQAQELFDGIGKATVLSMLSARGMSQNELSQGSEWAVVTQIDDTNVLVTAVNCLQSANNCETLIFTTVWSGGVNDAMREGARVYNSTKLYGRGYVDGTDFYFDMVSDVSKGVTRAHLDELLRLYVETALPDFVDVVSDQMNEGSTTANVRAGAPVATAALVTDGMTADAAAKINRIRTRMKAAGITNSFK